MSESITASNGTPEVRLALVERDIQQYGQIFPKIDQTLDKLANVLNSVNQILAVHESKINDYSIVEANLYKILDEHVKSTSSSLNNLTIVTSSLTSKADALTTSGNETRKITSINDDRISSLEQWKWIIVGAIGASSMFGSVFSQKLFELIGGIFSAGAH